MKLPVESNDFLYDHQMDHHCFDVLAFFIAIVDTRGKITYLNKRARELLNAKESEFIEENFIKKLVVKEDRGEIRIRFNEILKYKNVDVGTIRYHIEDNKKERRIIDQCHLVSKKCHRLTQDLKGSGRLHSPLGKW